MAVRILVVDDEPDVELLLKQKFRRKIQDRQYQFIFAANGVEALRYLEEHRDVEIVLSDINMPEMDGLTLIDNLRQKSFNPIMRSIIVSAYGDMENIRTAMNRGAFDFVTKPIDFVDLEKTIEKTILEQFSIRKAFEAREQLSMLRQELTIARKIQESIIPRIFPPFPNRHEVDIHATIIPAKEVGGDFYDYFFIDRDRLGILIGDVSGKGFPAAIFMAMARVLMKSTAMKGLSSSSCMNYVNEFLCSDNDSSMFVTAFYGILDLPTGTLEYCNAGHNPPFILRREGAIEPLPFEGGLVIGALPDFTYSERRARLRPGDAIWLYTDGVTEAMDTQGDFFTVERLIGRLAAVGSLPASGLVRSIIDDVNAFAQGAQQADDITIVALRYNGL
jgi:phosphoserine phosphatase RsbU/P